MIDWAYVTSPDGLWDALCWWLAERVPPRLARAVFTRVAAVDGDPMRFNTVWDKWTERHRLRP